MNNAQLLEHARKLIAIKSTDGNKDGLQQAIKLIADLVSAYPEIRIETFQQNQKPSLLVYVGPKRPDRFKVLLNGHIDVVPGKDSLFDLQVKQDMLHGRGALDMKLATLILADTFARIAPLLPYPAGLQIVSDEELGGYDGTRYQRNQGIEADFVIVGEYTNLNICTESKGFCRLKLTAHGKSAHSANLWNGQNAILKLLNALDKLLTIYPVSSEESWRTTVNVANIGTTNPALNLVPENAVAELDIRFTSDDPHFASKQTVRALCTSVDPTIGIEFVSDIEPAIQADSHNPFVSQLADSVNHITGSSPSRIRKHGSADARFYSPNAVVFGPSGTGIHGDDEQVSQSSLQAYARIIEDFLLRLAH